MVDVGGALWAAGPDGVPRQLVQEGEFWRELLGVIAAWLAGGETRREIRAWLDEAKGEGSPAREPGRGAGQWEVAPDAFEASSLPLSPGPSAVNPPARGARGAGRD